MKKKYDTMHYYTFALVILLSMMVYIAINYKSNIEKEMKYKTQIFDLEEELAESQESILNLNNIIAEMEDDIQSMEVQHHDELDSLIDENDYLAIKAAANNNIPEEIRSILTEDQLYLLNYIQEGGTINDIGEWKCTAYCTEKYAHICGTGTGITASGETVQAGVSVAINRANLDWLPFGTKIYIEGVGVRIIQDTGPGVATNQLDCAVYTHSNALRWSGAGTHSVWILL